MATTAFAFGQEPTDETIIEAQKRLADAHDAAYGVHLNQTQLPAPGTGVGVLGARPGTPPGTLSRTKLWVGSLAPQVLPEHLAELLGAFGTVTELTVPPGLDGSLHRGYAFVRFSTEEAATAARAAVEGMQFFGRALKVNCAKEPAAGIPATRPMAVPGVAGTPAAPPPNVIAALQKIVGQVNTHPITAQAAPVSMVPAASSVHSLAREENSAISTRNQRTELMQKLSRRDAPAPQPPVTTTSNPAHPMAGGGAYAPNSISSIASNGNVGNGNVGIGNGACALELRNMVGPGEDTEGLDTEVAEECANFGTVAAVRVSPSTAAEGAVVTVVFAGREAAERAHAALNGRFFGGRTVQATITSP